MNSVISKGHIITLREKSTGGAYQSFVIGELAEDFNMDDEDIYIKNAIKQVQIIVTRLGERSKLDGLKEQVAVYAIESFFTDDVILSKDEPTAIRLNDFLYFEASSRDEKTVFVNAYNNATEQMKMQRAGLVKAGPQAVPNLRQ